MNMNISKNKRYYIVSIAVLAVLSAYPVANGIRIAFINLANGAIEPEQYAKYVVPYAAICVSLLMFTALLPVFLKFKRLAFPIGLAAAYGAFFTVERFFETIQIHVDGMTLILAPSPTVGAVGQTATVDIWQAAQCAMSPVVLEQSSLTYAYQDRFLYVLGDSTYKIHYYLIALVLITMVCGLLYSIAKMLRGSSKHNSKPIFLRAASTGLLVAICLFANTTAFFRAPAAIQTPLASALTCMFFIVLGASAGVYAGSFLLGKKLWLGIGVPGAISLCAASLMYVGEAAMMNGHLYRFGTGWFFEALPKITLAPVDILVVLLSGASTWLILRAVRKHESPPGKITVVATAALCLALAASGLSFAATAPEYADDGVLGCYVFDENLYTSPLSSYVPFGGTPYVYAFDENSFIRADTGNGEVRTCSVEYCNTPVSTDEFSKVTDGFFSEWLPNLALYKERFLVAVINDGGGKNSGLYRMDGALWLVEFNGTGIWSIYKLKKTDDTTFADLERAASHFQENPQPTWPGDTYENQMTLADVFALARKGEALVLNDFDPSFYQLSGASFTVRKYDVIGADTVYVRENEGGLESALLLSRRTLDPAKCIDLREGFEAVAQYLNPLHSFDDIAIEGLEGLDRAEGARSLIYEYDYDECRYYLNAEHAGSLYVIFDSGERMQLRRALEERRTTVEGVVASGLYNVSMVPIDNPLGGEFTVLHHQYTFELNGEAFYPSKSFMYVAEGGSPAVYYDIDELVEIFKQYGHGEVAERLRQAVDPADLTAIARGNYVRDTALAEAGIETEVGWEFSSHTPVRFCLMK
ncbi:MAG: hypothetical protein FWG53_08340 [Clostridiales bacterium]|nr:hypothetical protein [Clostridiales bacterium]